MKGSILVVDDEATTRISLAEILQLEDYRVAVAENGEKALELLNSNHFDLMLLDIKMPGISGVEVLKRAAKVQPNCRTILLTAHGSLATAIEAVRQGAHDYLLKPASAGNILASVSRAINDRLDMDRRHKLIEQMEASLRMLKDAEGLETEKPAVHSVITLAGGIMIDLDRREIWQGELKATLTLTEGKLMKVFLENQGQVLSHREIVRQVHGYKTNDEDAPEVLRPLVSRLRRKLSQFPGGGKWISNLRGTGYIFDQGESQRSQPRGQAR